MSKKMKTQFIVTGVDRCKYIGLSFEYEDKTPFVTPIFYLNELPDVDPEQVKSYFGAILIEPQFASLLSEVASTAEGYMNVNIS